MPLRYGMNPHQTPAQLYTLKPKLPITGKGCVLRVSLLCLGGCVSFSLLYLICFNIEKIK